MRRTLVTHLSALALGLAVGIGAVAVADSSPTADQADSNSAVVRQLTKANRKLDLVNKNLGGFALVAQPDGSIYDILRTICRRTGASQKGCR